MENKKNSSFKIDRLRPTLFAASCFVLLAALGLWISAVIIALVSAGNSSNTMLFLDAIYYLPFIVLPMAIYMHKHSGLSEGLRLKPMSFASMIVTVMLGLAGVFICSILANIWVMLLESLGLKYIDTSSIPSSKSELSLSIFTMAAIPAICEELLMRGFVFSSWETRGTRRAIWISTIFFTLLHGNIYGIPAYIYTGLISAYLVFSLDSLYAGIVYHTVYNSGCLIASYAAANPSTVEQALALQETMSVSAMILSMLSQLALYGIIVAITLGALRVRRRIMGIQPFLNSREPLKAREKLIIVLALIPMIALLLLNI